MAKTTKKTVTKASAVQAVKDESVVKSVAGLSLDTVSAKLAAVQVETQKKLAEVSVKMTEQLSTLGDIERTIALKKDELQRLYQIESAAVDLDELNAKVAEQRELIKAEFDTHQRQLTEEKALAELRRAREESDYQYEVGKRRRQTEDEFQAGLSRRAQEVADREQKVKAVEDELIALRTEKAKFPETVKAECTRVELAARADEKRKYEADAAVFRKDMESQVKVLQSQVTAEQQKNGLLQQENSRLQKDLEALRNDYKAVSLAALERKGSGGRQSQPVAQPEPQPMQQAYPATKRY